MSEETTNKQDMPEQLSDILLVLDKEKMKIQAVKSIDEKGKMETVDPTKENQSQFMRVDKSGDFFSNFCHVLKKVYTFYINTKIRLQFKYNSKIYLQPPFFCNNFSIYNLPF